jgi:hypothetical protein
MEKEELKEFRQQIKIDPVKAGQQLRSVLWVEADAPAPTL